MVFFTARMIAVALLLCVGVLACDDEGGSDPVVPDASIDGGMLGDVELPADLGPDEGAPVGDMGERDLAPGEDMGGSERPPCDRDVNLGLLAEPVPVVPTQAFAPRAVFSGTEYALVWQTPLGGDRNTVWFQRFDLDGAAIGSAVEIGIAAVPQHAVAFDGQGYVVAWLAARTDESIFDGVRLRAVAADGTPSAVVVDVPDSFDSEQMAFDWAPFGGGMLLYTRGRNGQSGVFANSVDEGMTVSPQQAISASPAQSLTVVYGDGTWGAAWLARDGEQPAELVFVVLNDDAVVISDDEVRVRGGGIGNVHMAYGQGIYAAGWTRQGVGRPEATLSMFDGGGSPFAGTPLAGPDGVATVTDVTFIAPDRFAVAWQENRQSGTRVGLSRFDANGLMVPNGLVLDPPTGSARLGLTLGGVGSRLAVWFTEDPMPPPVGYSSAARVVSGVLAPCDR